MADTSTLAQSDTGIRRTDPETEPEFVGTHSGLPAGEGVCESWDGESRSDIDQCGAPATHTVVMYDGKKLHEIPMCDGCGEPDDLEDRDRRWSA